MRYRTGRAERERSTRSYRKGHMRRTTGPIKNVRRKHLDRRRYGTIKKGALNIPVIIEEELGITEGEVFEMEPKLDKLPGGDMLITMVQQRDGLKAHRREGGGAWFFLRGLLKAADTDPDKERIVGMVVGGVRGAKVLYSLVPPTSMPRQKQLELAIKFREGGKMPWDSGSNLK